MDEPTLDEIFETLKAERRRHALISLYNHGPMWKKKLEMHVAAAECEKNIDDLQEEELQRVRSTLHQDHLPKLDDHNFVLWDEETNAVALGPNCHLVLRKLDGIEPDDGTQWLATRLQRQE